MERLILKTIRKTRIIKLKKLNLAKATYTMEKAYSQMVSASISMFKEKPILDNSKMVKKMVTEFIEILIEILIILNGMKVFPKDMDYFSLMMAPSTMVSSLMVGLMVTESINIIMVTFTMVSSKMAGRTDVDSTHGLMVLNTMVNSIKEI